MSVSLSGRGLIIQFVAVATAALLSVAPAPATTLTDAVVPKQEQVILALHTQWAEARRKGDVAFLERFYAPELTLNVMDGKVATRASDIAAFANRDIKPDLVEDQDMVVRVYGQTAIVTGIEHVRGTAFGQPGDFRLRFTNVLVLQRGMWRLVHHQSTPIR